MANSRKIVGVRLAALAVCLAALLSLPAVGLAQADTKQETAEQADQMFIVNFALGENWDSNLAPSEQRNFQQHSTNLNRLRADGRIVFGARYADLGMIFLKAPSLESATSTLQADPGVIAGIFTFTVEPMNVFYPWLED